MIVGEVPARRPDQMRTQMDRLRQKAKSGVVLVGWADEGKVGLMKCRHRRPDGQGRGGQARRRGGEACGGKGGGRQAGVSEAYEPRTK
ncbi:MAG: hypothetical protein U0797_21525 [Gemmataceae bacterium]